MAEIKVGTLNVSAIGRVEVKPDIAIVRLSVTTRAKTAAEAVQENARSSAQVTNQVSTLSGVKQEDIETTGIRVSPVTREEEDTGRIIIEGYEAVNSIAVTVPVDMAGQVFDAGFAAGADESSGISFGLRDEQQYRLQALEEAVQKAKDEAQLVARAVGINLQAPRSINVEGRYGPVFKGLEMARGAADARVATPVFPGELTITATVSISYIFQP